MNRPTMRYIEQRRASAPAFVDKTVHAPRELRADAGFHAHRVAAINGH